MALWKAVSSVKFSCWDGVKWWNLWSCHSRRNTGKFGWDVKEKGFLGEKGTLWFSDHFHWLNGHEFEQAPGAGDGQGSLACCSPWGHKESDVTERLHWTNCTKPETLWEDPKHRTHPKTKQKRFWIIQCTVAMTLLQIIETQLPDESARSLLGLYK